MHRYVWQVSALRDERWAMLEERADMEHHLADAKAEATRVQVLPASPSVLLGLSLGGMLCLTTDGTALHWIRTLQGPRLSCAPLPG